EWGLLLSLARQGQSDWRWGINAKLLGHWLVDELGLGVGFDLGLWHNLGHGLSIGALLQDITTTQIFWSTGTRETVIPRVTVGGGWTFDLPILHRQVIIESELTTRLDGERLERTVQAGPVSLIGRTGLEVSLNENLVLRAGKSAILPLSLGLGLDFPVFSVDYGYIENTSSLVFEPSHQITVNLFLGELRDFLGM
ncbi:MAG: hypothetical protein KAU50_02705, partial [Candidatus Marinimicrobia bacterium]|nr:hypothetical protein [Candidatus Neomarinimicrobiota bacterium]